MPYGDASKPSSEFQKEKDEINRKFRGFDRKLRLHIAEGQYALALLEGGLGDPGVRKNWELHFDRMWRARRDPETAARETLLMAVVFADRNYAKPHVGWKKPRESFQNFLGKDANGTTLTITVSVPYELEAAERAIESVASFDPENAAIIPAAGLAAVIPVFANRHANVGRRGKQTHIDTELCKLVKTMGLTPVTPQAMRRQRTKFETSLDQRRVEEARALHLEAGHRERLAHGL